MKAIKYVQRKKKVLQAYMNENLFAWVTLRTMGMGQDGKDITLNKWLILFYCSLNYGDTEECSELRSQLTEDVRNCRQLLTAHCEKHTSFVPYHILELTVAMLLNLEDLSFFKNGKFDIVSIIFLGKKRQFYLPKVYVFRQNH